MPSIRMDLIHIIDVKQPNGENVDYKLTYYIHGNGIKDMDILLAF